MSVPIKNIRDVIKSALSYLHCSIIAAAERSEARVVRAVLMLSVAGEVVVCETPQEKR